MSDPAKRTLPEGRVRVSEYLDPEHKVISLSHANDLARGPRKLTPSEERLSRWLRRELHTAGAQALVRRYGAQAVLEALHDGIVERFEPEQFVVDRALRSYPANVNVREWLEQDGLVAVWRAHPELKSPGGMLRFVLREVYDE